MVLCFLLSNFVVVVVRLIVKDYQSNCYHCYLKARNKAANYLHYIPICDNHTSKFGFL